MWMRAENWKLLIVLWFDEICKVLKRFASELGKNANCEEVDRNDWRTNVMPMDSMRSPFILGPNRAPTSNWPLSWQLFEAEVDTQKASTRSCNAKCGSLPFPTFSTATIVILFSRDTIISATAGLGCPCSSSTSTSTFSRALSHVHPTFTERHQATTSRMLYFRHQQLVHYDIIFFSFCATIAPDAFACDRFVSTLLTQTPWPNIIIIATIIIRIRTCTPSSWRDSPFTCPFHFHFQASQPPVRPATKWWPIRAGVASSVSILIIVIRTLKRVRRYSVHDIERNPLSALRFPRFSSSAYRNNISIVFGRPFSNLLKIMIWTSPPPPPLPSFEILSASFLTLNSS